MADSEVKQEEQNSDLACRMAIRNISYDTTDEDFKELYEQFGSVEECKIMRTKEENKSRGFGFVRYTDEASVDEAMANRPHELDGRTLEPHRAAPKFYARKPESHHTCNEIFVGDLKPEVTEEDLNEYFGAFGNIEKITIPVDKDDETKIRGFAIVKFDDYDPVDVTCYKQVHHIKEHRLFITKSINRKDMNELRRRYGRINDAGAILEQILPLLAPDLRNKFKGAMRGARRGGRGRGNKPYSRGGK